MLAIAERNDVGLNQEELLNHPRLVTFYNANLGAAYQAFADDVKDLAGQSLQSMRAQHPPTAEALIRFDATTKRFHLAEPLHVLHLSDPALAALHALLKALQGGAALPGGQELFDRLVAIVPTDQRQFLVSSTSVPQSVYLDMGMDALDAYSEQVAQLLLRARHERRTIEFQYQPPQNSVPTRHAGDEVIGIYIGQHPYVTVWCADRQKEFDLRLERFVPGTLKLMPNLVNPRERQGISVRYSLTPHLAESSSTIHLEQQHVMPQEDGSTIISGMARSVFWAHRLLLGYGEHARALDPPQLVAAMQKTITAMAARYADNASSKAMKEV
jgi:predicted DNA-binding transcriptional regulator YafY